MSNKNDIIPTPRRAGVDSLFGADRVTAAIERAGRTPRLNSEELSGLAAASQAGSLVIWWSRLAPVVQDGVILAMLGLEADTDAAEELVRITQTFPAGLIERADKLAAREGQSRAAILRRCVAAGLYRLGG